MNELTRALSQMADAAMGRLQVEERLNRAFTDALQGRVLNVAALASFQREAFIAADGLPNLDAISAWVASNSTVEVPGARGKAEAARRYRRENQAGLEDPNSGGRAGLIEARRRFGNRAEDGS